MNEVNKMDAKRCIKARDYFTTRADGKGLDDQARGLAVMALEKQIPKKVVRSECYRHIFLCCPGCQIVLKEEHEEIFTDFCIRCGQRLEWGID